ncbi:response regulator transcription factor [Algoriphagus sp. NF]|uniref:response regulator n=1 Tax=Algoriphagus TaxID=246875 RepID=UPI000414BEB8|nr:MULTISPECIES: response regulator transcription factor [Algoriphagus]MDE0560947.1 response regulator transcription factor [Algoriphagus sp. NF]
MDNQRHQVIIADDHPILLKGLHEFLADLGLEVIGAFHNGKDALDAIVDSQPPLAILDLEMPEMTGLEVAADCKKLGLKTRVILLTLHKELKFYQQAKELNISGYILKEFALNDLRKAIDTVLSGQEFFSEKLFEGLKKEDCLSDHSLTPSELKILRLIADGHSTKEIAEQLFISERTVDKHRSNIISKLNLEKKHNSLLIWAQNNKDNLY